MGLPDFKSAAMEGFRAWRHGLETGPGDFSVRDRLPVQQSQAEASDEPGYIIALIHQEAKVNEQKEPQSQEQASTQDVVEELNELGQKLGAALKSLWESPERQELEQEVREGLRTLGQQVDQVIDAAKERLAAEKVPQQAQEIAETVERSPVVQEVRAALLSGLRFLNQELARALKQKAPSEPGEQPSGASGPDQPA
mgnify:FL=1